MKVRDVEYTYDPSKFYNGSGGSKKKVDDSDDGEIEIYLNFGKQEKTDEDILSSNSGVAHERVIKVQE